MKTHRSLCPPILSYNFRLAAAPTRLSNILRGRLPTKHLIRQEADSIFRIPGWIPQVSLLFSRPRLHFILTQPPTREGVQRIPIASAEQSYVLMYHNSWGVP